VLASPVLELTALYVLPEAWARGVGSTLHAAYLSYLDQIGLRHGELEVLDRNERAKAFYQRRGWTATNAARPGPLDTPFVTMTLTRRPP
jgi:GNAT superfamily N-acetyltransferase